MAGNNERRWSGGPSGSFVSLSHNSSALVNLNLEILLHTTILATKKLLGGSQETLYFYRGSICAALELFPDCVALIIRECSLEKLPLEIIKFLILNNSLTRDQIPQLLKRDPYELLQILDEILNNSVALAQKNTDILYQEIKTILNKVGFTDKVLRRLANNPNSLLSTLPVENPTKEALASLFSSPEALKRDLTALISDYYSLSDIQKRNLTHIQIRDILHDFGMTESLFLEFVSLKNRPTPKSVPLKDFYDSVLSHKNCPSKFIQYALSIKEVDLSWKKALAKNPNISPHILHYLFKKFGVIHLSNPNLSNETVYDYISYTYKNKNEKILETILKQELECPKLSGGDILYLHNMHHIPLEYLNCHPNCPPQLLQKTIDNLKTNPQLIKDTRRFCSNPALTKDQVDQLFVMNPLLTSYLTRHQKFSFLGKERFFEEHIRDLFSRKISAEIVFEMLLHPEAPLHLLKKARDVLTSKITQSSSFSSKFLCWIHSEVSFIKERLEFFSKEHFKQGGQNESGSELRLEI